MSRRSIGQAGFGFAQPSRSSSSLDEIAALIDWQPVGALLGSLYPSTKGEPAWPPLAMFKALLLAVWSDLSDVKRRRGQRLTIGCRPIPGPSLGLEQLDAGGDVLPARHIWYAEALRILPPRRPLDCTTMGETAGRRRATATTTTEFRARRMVAIGRWRMHADLAPSRPAVAKLRLAISGEARPRPSA